MGRRGRATEAEATAAAAVEGLDLAARLDEREVEVHVSDADLEDATLLEELAGLAQPPQEDELAARIRCLEQTLREETAACRFFKDQGLADEARASLAAARHARTQLAALRPPAHSHATHAHATHAHAHSASAAAMAVQVPSYVAGQAAYGGAEAAAHSHGSGVAEAAEATAEERRLQQKRFEDEQASRLQELLASMQASDPPHDPSTHADVQEDPVHAHDTEAGPLQATDAQADHVPAWQAQAGPGQAPATGQSPAEESDTSAAHAAGFVSAPAMGTSTAVAGADAAAAEGDVEAAEAEFRRLAAAARAAKDAGERGRALELLQAAKQAKARLVALRSNSATPHAASAASATQPPQPTAETALQRSAEAARQARFAEVEARLRQQVARWTQLALEAKQAGELPMAVKYHKEKKAMAADLRQVAAARATPGAAPPLVEEEAYEHLQEVHFRGSIGEQQLEVAVVRARGLQPAKGCATVDSYVLVSCPLPPLSGGQGGSQQWRTRKVANNSSPEYKEVFRFDLDRSKRSLARYAHKKRLSFEVLHGRFMRADLSLGKCELPLDALLSRAEVRRQLPLLHGRRDSGALLDVRLRLCYPLAEKHIERVTEQILRVVRHFPPQQPIAAAAAVASVTSLVAQAPPQHTQSPQPQEQTLADDTTTEAVVPPPPAEAHRPPPSVGALSPPQQTTTPAEAATVATSVQKPAADVGGGGQASGSGKAKAQTEDYDAVARLVSNDVLEWALDEATREVAAARARGEAVAEEVATRVQQLEAALQVLVVQVQTGALDEEAYVQRVQAAIAEERALAKRLVKTDRRQAQRALLRAKIMAKELEGE